MKKTPEVKYCPFCRSVRLRRSLSMYLCNRCHWWFGVTNVHEEPLLQSHPTEQHDNKTVSPAEDGLGTVQGSPPND